MRVGHNQGEVITRLTQHYSCRPANGDENAEPESNGKTDIVEDINQYKNGHPHVQLANELPLQVQSSLWATKLCLSVLRVLLCIRFLSNKIANTCAGLIEDDMAHGRRG